MKNVSKKVLIALASVMMVSSFYGCKKNAPTSTETPTEKYPAKTGIKLSWYMIGGSNGVKIGDRDYMIELQKRTGIDIDFIEISKDNNDQDEQLKMMIASGSYPDMIHWKLNAAISGGVPKLIQDGVAIKLNDLIEKNAPNLNKIFKDNPDIKREMQFDDGTIATFPIINPLKSKEDLRQVSSTGFVIRKDWLDKTGLNVPTTINEWYTMLKAFKNSDPNGDGSTNELPFDGTGLNMLAPSWGVRTTFYVHPKTGKIAYGPIEPEYKDYMTTLNKWYSEGLIGRNTLKADGKLTDANITGDLTGSFKGLTNAWTKYLPNLQKKNPNAQFVGAPWPKGPAGKVYTDRTELISHNSQDITVITSSCKNPDAAVKVIDFMYGKDGSEIMSWGVEGTTFEKKDGKNVFIPVPKPDGTGTSIPRPTVALPKFGGSDAYNTVLTPEQSLGADVWAEADSSLQLPSSITLTADENTKVTEILSSIGTYGTDMFNKFVSGEEPLSNFDSYVQTLKKMKIEEATKIYQAAYDRYKARK